MVGCIKIACTWTNVWVYSGRGVCFIIITIHGLLKTVSLFAKGKITLNSQLKDYVKKIVLREGGSLIVLNKLYNKSKHFKWIQNNVKIRTACFRSTFVRLVRITINLLLMQDAAMEKGTAEEHIHLHSAAGNSHSRVYDSHRLHQKSRLMTLIKSPHSMRWLYLWHSF